MFGAVVETFRVCTLPRWQDAGGLRLQYQLLRIGRQTAIQVYAIQPIAWIEKGQVMISKLKPTLSKLSKS